MLVLSWIYISEDHDVLDLLLKNVVKGIFYQPTSSV